ncbi:MAG: ROK family protein [Acidobacteriota bacterium]|jgi:fructokinase
MYAAIEAGGTKFVCGYGKGPGEIEVSAQIRTRSPRETMAEVEAFFAGRKFKRAGIACFGPLEISKGKIAKLTPKIEWRGYGIRAVVEKMLGCKAVLDTDVNGAVMGEKMWGAARNSENFVYVTVGTGIGGGVMVNGRLVHGLLHPEIGHMRVRRFMGDDFPGNCPVHGDCLEGLAAGPAIAARWGAEKAELLAENHLGWAMEAHYLGQLVVNLACTYSPEILILGGGISGRRGMLAMVRQAAAKEMGHYAPLPRILAPRLGARAGVLGALALARFSSR